MSRRNLAFTDAEWTTLAALANLPATLPGKKGDVPVSDTERLRAALRRLGELARNPKSATERERALVADLVRLFAVPRVRGGTRAGGFETGNRHNPRAKKDREAQAALTVALDRMRSLGERDHDYCGCGYCVVRRVMGDKEGV